MKIAQPVNAVQTGFNELCGDRGGHWGVSARSQIQELLFQGGRKMNAMVVDEMSRQLTKFPSVNPWHVCFAVGLGWGPLAKVDEDFTAAAVEVLSALNPAALSVAKTFHLERGPAPIERSLRGGYLMFQRVALPATLPADLQGMRRAQDRWFAPLISTSSDRPRYIGAWNATAMFLLALFARPALAAALTNQEVLLPPG